MLRIGRLDGWFLPDVDVFGPHDASPDFWCLDQHCLTLCRKHLVIFHTQQDSTAKTGGIDDQLDGSDLRSKSIQLSHPILSDRNWEQ